MWLDRLLDPFRGKAITIPPLDGALKPNTALDEAPLLANVERPDNLVVADGRLVFSSGPRLLALTPDGRLEELAVFDHPVTALAAFADGGLVIGLDDGAIVFRGGAHHGCTLPGIGPGRLACPVAISVMNATTIVVAQGSARHRPSDWVVDLMEKNATGSVWRFDLEDGSATALGENLAFPNGLLIEADRSVVVAESWRHRLVRLAADGRGRVEPVLSKLAGYPARLAPATGGGAWLALFAPRNRLIEFVLSEDAYRADMIRDVERDYWIAPALSSGRSFLEPLQCGGVRTMGIHKPWAPSRSYGLVVRLDAALAPVASWHSRADGARHGVTAIVEHEGRLIVASKGGDALVAIAPETETAR